MLEAEASGKTPALCSANSTFETDLNKCNACIALNGGSNLSSSGTPPVLIQFLNYCSSIAAGDTAQISVLQSLITQVSAQLASESSLLASLEAGQL